MSTERQIFDYIVDNAALEFDEEAQERLVEDMNDALREVTRDGFSKASEYFELYRSSNGNYYWYVMINTIDFKRWIVTDISRLNISELEDIVLERKAARSSRRYNRKKKKAKRAKDIEKQRAKRAAKARVLRGIILRSDARCKEVVECVMTVNGVNIYEWVWLDTPQTPVSFVGGSGVGVIAQEVLETHPDCVLVDEEGYYTVDYDKLYGIIYK